MRDLGCRALQPNDLKHGRTVINLTPLARPCTLSDILEKGPSAQGRAFRVASHYLGRLHLPEELATGIGGSVFFDCNQII